MFDLFKITRTSIIINKIDFKMNYVLALLSLLSSAMAPPNENCANCLQVIQTSGTFQEFSTDIPAYHPPELAYQES